MAVQLNPPLVISSLPFDIAAPLAFDGEAFALHDGALYTSRFAGDIAKTLAALPALGGVVIADQSAAVSAVIMLPSNVAVIGRAGVTITQTDPTQDLFGFTGGSNVQVRGLNLVGGRCAFAAYNASNYTIAGNRVAGWHYRAIDLGQNMPDTSILENTFTAPDPGMTDAVFAQDVGANFRFCRNRIDTTGCTNAQAHGLALHTFASAGVLTDAHVEDNFFIHAGGNFAVEIGAFGGARPVAPIVRGNRFRFAAQTNGALSLASCDDALCLGNVIDCNLIAPSIMAIEVVTSAGALVQGCIVRNGAADGRALIFDSTSRCMATGNKFAGAVFISSGVSGQPQLDHNSVTNNDVLIAAGSVWAHAIYLHANVAGCQAVNNRIQNNGVIAPAGCNLITLEQSAGVIDATIVTGNPGAVFNNVGNAATNTVLANGH
jgi:hypothetical protein